MAEYNAAALPPSKGGVHVRLWNKNFDCLYDNVATDESLNAAWKRLIDGERMNHG